MFKTCKCGSETFYMRQKVHGIIHFEVDKFGEPADNSDMHDYLTHEDLRKYYRCVDCDRKAEEEVSHD